MINNLLQYCYEQGWGDTIYSINGTITLATRVLFLIFYRKKYNVKLWQTAIAIIIIFKLSDYVMLTLGWIESGFQSWTNGNFERVCVYIPLLALLVAKILKIPFGKMVDYIAPGIALQKVVGPFGCPFFGCCYGCDCSWGIWNPFTEEKVFPVQWLECILVLFIFLYLLRLAKNEKYAGTGKIYANFLLIYGIVRFFLGYLKGGSKILLGISNLEIHAFLMILVGTAWLMALYEKDQLQISKQNTVHGLNE